MFRLRIPYSLFIKKMGPNAAISISYLKEKATLEQIWQILLDTLIL